MNSSGTGRPAIPSSSSRFALRTLAVGLVCCVLAAVPSALFDLDRHSAPKEVLLHLTALLAGAVLFAALREVRVSRLDAVLGAWLLVGVASSVGAENPWLALRALSVGTSGVIIFWLSRTLAQGGWATSLQRIVAFATALAAVTALAQAYGLDLPIFAETRAPGGTFGNRNFMAHTVALGLPTLLLTGFRSRPGRGWSYLGTTLVFAALVLSRTRAAWLAAGLAGGVALPLALGVRELRTSSELRQRGLRLILAALLGAAAALALPNSLDWRSSNPYLETALGVVNYKGGSGKGRLIQYRNTLGMVADHPALGVGPGNWPVEYSRYASRRDPSLGATSLMPTNPWPSSDWVGFLVEWGPAGLVLLALALGSLGLRGMQGALGANAAEARLQAIALVSTVTALAVVGAVDSVLHLATPNFLFWAAAGALAPAARPWKTFRPGTGAKAFLFVAFLALAGALTVRSAAQVGAIVVAGHGWRIADLETASFLDPGSYRLHMLLAERWTRQGRCDRARPHAEAALRLFPNLPAPKRLMATCGKPAATNSGSP